MNAVYMCSEIIVCYHSSYDAAQVMYMACMHAAAIVFTLLHPYIYSRPATSVIVVYAIYYLDCLVDYKLLI